MKKKYGKNSITCRRKQRHVKAVFQRLIEIVIIIIVIIIIIIIIIIYLNSSRTLRALRIYLVIGLRRLRLTPLSVFRFL